VDLLRDECVKKFTFKARIEEGRGGGAFVFFPYDVEKEFNTKGKVPVKATFDGVPYTGSLAKYGYPQHILGVPKAVRDEIGKRPGSIAQVEVWKDEEERKIEVPPELQRALKKEGLLAFFEKLSYTHQKEYCRWITEAKKEETRSRRLEKAVEMMKQGVKTPD
jgi:hypothetical protein